MGSWAPIQYALLAESLCNIYGSLAIYYDPNSMLTHLHPATTLATSFGALEAHAYWIAALTLGITPSFLVCIPDGPHQAMARRALYTTWLGFEAMMVATAVWQLTKAESGYGVQREGLYGTIAIFAGFTLLRVVFLFIKPEWMESKSLVKKRD